MARLDHERHQLVGRLVALDEHHLRARHHDVADLHVGDRQHPLQHDQRVAVEQPAFARLAQLLDQVGEVARLAGHRLGDSLEPAAGTAWFCSDIGEQDTRSRIGVRKSKPIKDLNLTRGHLAGLAPSFVVKPSRCSTPCTVRCAQWDCGDLRCLRASRSTMGAQITNSPMSLPPSGTQARAGKRQHIGRLVLAAVAAVQAAAARGTDHAYRQLRRPPAPLERNGCPACKLRRARNPGTRAPHSGVSTSDASLPSIYWPRRPARCAAPADGARHRATETS